MVEVEYYEMNNIGLVVVYSFDAVSQIWFNCYAIFFRFFVVGV